MSYLQDWHCPDHVSFAATHSGKEEFEETDLQYDKTGRYIYVNTIGTYFCHQSY